MNLQFFGGRGSASGSTSNSTNTIQNTFKSEFGFENVGTREERQLGFGMTTMVGTVTPSANDVQQYLDTGKFDNYGTNAAAKKQIVKQITRDMNGRGFEIQISEDGTKFLPNGDTGKTLTLGRNKDKWQIKTSSSSGSVSRGGMKGALDRSSRR